MSPYLQRVDKNQKLALPSVASIFRSDTEIVVYGGKLFITSILKSIFYIFN